MNEIDAVVEYEAVVRFRMPADEKFEVVAQAINGLVVLGCGPAEAPATLELHGLRVVDSSTVERMTVERTRRS